MPYYDFRCRECHKSESHYRKIDGRNDPQLHCATPMQRVISSAALRLELQAYVSPASGKLISSRAQRREDLLREGCVEYEPGLKEHIAKNKLEQDEKNFLPVAAAIDQTVSSLHASGHISGD